MDRRTLLRLGGVGLVGTLAGCAGSGGETTTQSDTTPTVTPTSTTSSGGGGGGGNPPGADQLGGPDDLQSSATVDATVLSSDEGAGQYVNTPAVVWVETGGSVTWTIAEGSHSITAYHPDNDKPLRIPEGAASFGSEILSSGKTFEHTFDTPGVYNYYCRPHEGLGMVGLVIVKGPQGGPGTTAPKDVEQSAASKKLARLLEVAGIEAGAGGGTKQAYTWQDATWDSYWYSLYNMSTNIAMSGNGVLFPHNDQQQKAFNERVPAMLKHADTDKPPIKNPNLNMAPFTKGDPHFTQKPVFDAGDGRPDASTLKWDMSKSSKVVSPSSVAWTHLKGVTWAKNFQAHFETLPPEIAAKFRAQMLTTLAQIGIKATLIAGGPQGNGALTKGDSLELISGFAPGKGQVVDDTARPNHHSAMLWFLSDLSSLAQNGWFGYVNPKPLIPKENIQKLTDGMAKTTMSLFSPGDVASKSTRDVGQMLGAVGWYGTHAGNADLRTKAATYADGLAAQVEANLASSGRVKGGGENQAATQGAIGQGLLWASQVEGVDHTSLAEEVLTYLFEGLWDEKAGTFASGSDDSTYRITSRDAGDVTGGINAADAVLGWDVKETYARYFNQTFNRGRLQRAERPPSHNGSAEHPLPLPPKAGGEFGQAAVYNNVVEYDTGADEWAVADDMFTTAWGLYTSNQDIWIGQWAGDFFQGRGVPGKSDEPPQ